MSKKKHVPVTKKINDNLALSIGTEGARRRDISNASNAYYFRRNRIPYEELNAIYQQSPIARRAVDLVCKYLLKNGFTLDIPDHEGLSEKVIQLWNKIGMDKLISDVTKDALISGHSVLLLKERMSDPTKPLDLKSLKGKEPEFIYIDARYITTVPDMDPFSKDFYKPKQYAISGTVVDKSYIIEFSALDVTNYLKPNYKYMGMSIYEPAFRTLISDDLMSKAIPNIVWRSSIVNYKITGFKQALEQGKEDQVLKYISTTEDGKSILGATVIDGEDSAEVLTRDIAGLDGLDQRSIYRLSAAFGIPAVILLGKSPDGQNSTGRADFEAFYNYIEEWQYQWTPAINKIFTILIACVSGEDNIPFDFKFNKVNMQSPQQKIENDGRVLDNVGKMDQLSIPVSAIVRYLSDNGIINEDEATDINELDKEGLPSIGENQSPEEDPFGQEEPTGEQEKVDEPEEGIVSRVGKLLKGE